MKKLLFIALLFPSLSIACDESRLVGNTYLICAHTEDHTEGNARSSLSLTVSREFESYCRQSRECMNADKKVIPKRTECLSNPSGGYYEKYKCTQLTAYEIY